METRSLGRTRLEVGVIGLGTEYLVGAAGTTVTSVVRQAVEQGVNYFDVLFSYRDYLDNFGAAFKGLRQKVYIAGHLGSGEDNGQYRKTRDLKECQEIFENTLVRLGTDHVEVLYLSNCDKEDDYAQIMADGGLLDLARRLIGQGKARFIGFSGHQVPVARKAVESGNVDVLMLNVNLSSDAAEGRKELYQLCASVGVGVVAMKPFAGGALLEKKAAAVVTPVQCLSYALSQPGVATAVPGVKDLKQLQAALGYLDATAEQRDFSGVVGAFQQDVSGRCVYCNHCLPCPARIDIAATFRLLSAAGDSVSEAMAEAYANLPAKASDCIECGVCAERCPFKVDIVTKMAQAAKLFEGS